MKDASDDMNYFRRHHLGRGLARAHWTFASQFESRIRAAGFDDFRPADVQIIARLPTGSGARITELAARAHITKQAVGKLVNGLEARGYVTRHKDPADGRATQVALSPRGEGLLLAAQDVIAKIEAEWAVVLGQTGLETLRDGLLAVSDALGPPEYL
jgi:DNA-binding MarR family transcriptional regulator